MSTTLHGTTECYKCRHSPRSSALGRRVVLAMLRDEDVRARAMAPRLYCRWKAWFRETRIVAHARITLQLYIFAQLDAAHLLSTKVDIRDDKPLLSMVLPAKRAS